MIPKKGVELLCVNRIKAPYKGKFRGWKREYAVDRWLARNNLFLLVVHKNLRGHLVVVSSKMSTIFFCCNVGILGNDVLSFRMKSLITEPLNKVIKFFLWLFLLKKKRKKWLSSVAFHTVINSMVMTLASVDNCSVWACAPKVGSSWAMDFEGQNFGLKQNLNTNLWDVKTFSKLEVVVQKRIKSSCRVLQPTNTGLWKRIWKILVDKSLSQCKKC